MGRTGTGGEPMLEVRLRRSRRGAAGRLGAAAVGYAVLGWPVSVGACASGDGGRPPRVRWGRGREAGRACSCDRVGCPAPGAHPVSPAWQIEASSDPAQVGRWWRESPDASITRVPGRGFDVLAMPAAAGTLALARMDRDRVPVGPVALTADDRALFFVVTRGAPASEDEWWSCHLDCEPGAFEPVAGLRWHCRESYVVGPPSRGGRGLAGHWIRDPRDHPLPDGLRPLEFLADACDEMIR